MARIRTIKPDAPRHEGLFALEQETGYPIRAAWYCMPMICDREGRFRWRPQSLKLDILPYDDIDFSRVLDAFVTRGFIVKYRVGRVWYGCIPTFRKHQHINNRELNSELPALSDAEEVIQEVTDACATRGSRVHGHAQGEGEGEGKGKGSKTLMSGKPDVGVPASGEKKKNGRDCAIRLLEFLNEKAERRYQPVKVNVELIIARLNEGATETQCRQVISRKCQEWRGDERMAQYLRPATLFNRTKFAQYVGELGSPLKAVSNG